MTRPFRSPRVRLALLGRSEQGRPLRALLLGDDDAAVRILILSGQHGDERMARTVVQRVARTIARSPDRSEHVALAVIRNLNPDGAARRTRANALGMDLNRDHLRLETAEVRALHRFIRSWSPHLIVDVHNYPSRRSHLLARGLAYCHDLFLDVPTCPAASTPGPGGWEALLLAPLLDDLAALGHRCGRYTLVKPSGRTRHSTPDLLDARNGLALRFGIPVVLVEGRRASRTEGRDARRRVRDAMTAALERVVPWAEEHRDRLTATDLPQPGDPIAIGSRHARGRVPFRMAFRDLRTDTIRDIDLSATYTPGVEVTRHATVPIAYAVPRSHRALIDLLERLGFPSESPEPGRRGRVERLWLHRVRPPRRPDRPPRVRWRREDAEDLPLDGYLVYPTNHQGGRALVVLLEPGSKYGLARFPDLGLRPERGTAWPVLRIMETRFGTGSRIPRDLVGAVHPGPIPGPPNSWTPRRT